MTSGRYDGAANQALARTNPGPMTKIKTEDRPVYLANGVVEGVLIPERQMLIAADGTQYRCTISPKLEAWYSRHPDEASLARAFVVYPRTFKGQGVQFHVVGTPQVDPAELPQVSGMFRVQGVVTNLRGQRNQTVVRVKRNENPDLAQRKKHAWAQHLIFLTGRVSPSELFVGNHVNFTCCLVGHELRIQGAHPIGGPTLEWVNFGESKIPWPFNPRKTSTWAQFRRKNNLVGPFGYLRREPLKDVILEKLSELRAMVRRLKRDDRYATDATFNRDVDRLRLVHQRIESYAAKAAPNALLETVEKEGLLRLLNLVLTPAPACAGAPAPAASKATKASPRKPAPAPMKHRLTPLEQKIHKAMSIGMLDDRLMVMLDLGRDDLKAAIASMDKAGLLEDGSLAEARSHQLKRYRKQKSENAAQLAAV